MQELLFAYGTLRDERIRELVLGRRVKGEPDAVQGFRRETLRYGNMRYPVLVVDSNVSDLIYGTVFVVSGEDLDRLDQYEGPFYLRICVQLISGRRAWMYAKVQGEYIAAGS